MANYKVFWVPDNVSSRDGTQEMPNTTALINQWAEGGYEVVSIVPGTNAQTWVGLFVTLKR